MAPGKTVPIQVTFKNAGDQTWPDPRTADAAGEGAYAVRLSYRWWGPGESVAHGEYTVRADLPKPLAPGESVTLTIPVEAPAKPGRYKLQFDLVQELVVWFEDKGAPRRTVPVTVQ